ncbi:hypothetical protein KDA00_01770 [Candidatus Saccharibacteria bacterium]|nr:hypothetical protein [Candidatus Saccharibacteria bacterium]
MMNVINELLNPNAFENDNRTSNRGFRDKLSAEDVDKLALELAIAFNNLKYVSYYCGVIYDFGPNQVHEWKRRVSDSKEPGKLFSKIVTDCRKKLRVTDNEK